MRAHELADVMPQLEHLHQLYKVLAKARQQRGAIDFESSEVRLPPRRRRAKSCSSARMERNDAHKLIEECMIAANVEAAKFLRQAADSGAVSRARAAAGVEVRGPARVPARVRADAAAAWTGDAGRFHGAAEEGPQAPRRQPDRIGAAALAEPGRVPARTTPATSAWRWTRTRTSPRRSGAIRTCSCIARSARAGQRQAGRLHCTARATWPRCACTARRTSAAPTRPSATSTSATSARGWKSTSAASSTASSPA